MKKWISIVCVVAMLLAMSGGLSMQANAATVSGTCGDNLTWTLEENNLVISGTGPMFDYTQENPAPWANQNVYNCTIENGVTSIGDYAFFSDSWAGLKIDIAASVTRIGHKAFGERQSIICFMGDAVEIADDAFENGYGDAFYITGWNESDLQSYGGNFRWVKGQLEVLPQTKSVYAQNEEIKREDFLFRAIFNGGYAINYSPRAIQIAAYDNTTYGEKQVTVVADEYEFVHTYFVTNGQHHFQYVNVDIPSFQYFTGSSINVEPIVTAGDYLMQKDLHYTVSYQNNVAVGSNAQVTVTGIGEWEGFSKTVSFYILKKNIEDADSYVKPQPFTGLPVTPSISIAPFITDGYYSLTQDEDYVVGYENNVNMGTASYYVAGINNFYGYITGDFAINAYNEPVKLSGAYCGNISGELTEEISYQQVLLAPGVFRGEIDNRQHRHYAYYELYQIVGEEPVLVTTYEPDYGYYNYTAFTYDFSSIYEEAAEDGGAVYMMAYTWVDSTGSVYTGVAVLYIPAKVPEATSIVVEEVEGVEDFRRTYLVAYGPDGNVGNIEWTVSNPAVATVSGGIVTFHQSGTVTVTARYGNLSDSWELIVDNLDLTKCQFVNYDPQSGKIDVCYDYVLLTEGTDYESIISIQDDITQVTVVGQGLFKGQLIALFDSETGELLEHIHTFDSCTDTSCDSCAFTKEVHHYLSDGWIKDQTHHWHTCTACDEKVDYAEHSLLPDNSEECTVCGILWVPGDVNGDQQVDNKDVEYLLWYTLFAEDYPLNAEGDVNGDGSINNLDVEYLLWHTLFAEDYPL